MYDFHGTECNFVHKRIIGAVGGFIGGGPGGAVGGFLGGGGGQIHGFPAGGRTRAQALAQQRADAARFSFMGRTVAECPGGTKADARGICQQRERGVIPFIQSLVPGGATGFETSGGGEVIMGRYGAGMIPIEEQRLHSTCLPGMVLGNDDICYNRKDLKNNERLYPKGRRPLLTGGDRNAITRAARAARAIQRTEKQLQKMGMLRKPTRRAAPKVSPYRQIGPGGPSIINVE